MLTAQVPKVCPRRPPASETPRPGRPAFHPLRTPSARSGRVPRESLDAAENLPKEASRQVAFGELQGEVPGMSDEASARLEQPLLETREGQALDGDGQNQPAQQIAEVIGDHPEQQADLVGPKPVTGEPAPVGGFLAFLVPLLGRPALIIEADDGAIRSGQGSDDEAHPRKQLAEVMFDLGDDPSRSAPGGGLILEAPVTGERRVTGA